jgi:formamidopyrimidine-DNA glycosylase
MPEAPDLEVIKDSLNRRVPGLVVEGARVLKPLELRVLTPSDMARDVVGRSILGCRRRGKFLLLDLSEARMLVINPMLTGTLWLCHPSVRILKRTSFALSLSDGNELRYLDETQMGMAYYIDSSQLVGFQRLLDTSGPERLG